MRERLYITTCPNNWSENYCIKKSKTINNVIMYSTQNKSIYLNGLRYGSINNIDDVLNNSILFTISQDSYNVLHLSQNDLTIETNLIFDFLNKELHNDDVIKCHVGERIQILSNIPVNIYNNKQYYWRSSSNSLATIDRNNIITPLKVSPLTCSISLVNVDDDTDILFSLKLLIYEKTRPFKKIGEMTDADITNDAYNMEDNYHDIIWDKVDDAIKDNYPYIPVSNTTSTVHGNLGDINNGSSLHTDAVNNTVSNIISNTNNEFFTGRIDFSENKIYTAQEWVDHEAEMGDLHG